MKFIDQIWVAYPFPREASIWGDTEDGALAVSSLEDLVEMCVDELASDIMLTDTIVCHNQATPMPEGTVSVYSAKYEGPYGFQGNRSVKFNYDPHRNMVFLRIYPAAVSYNKRLTVEALDTLKGDRLIYCKSYVLWRMSEKELTVMKSVNFSADNATLNFETLGDFVEQQKKLYEDMKPEIMIYAGNP